MEKIIARKPGFKSCFPALLQVWQLLTLPHIEWQNWMNRPWKHYMVWARNRGWMVGQTCPMVTAPNSPCQESVTEVLQMWIRQCSEKLDRVILWREENQRKSIIHQHVHVIVNRVWGSMFCACWWKVRWVHAHGNEPRTSGPETMCFREVINASTYPTSYDWCSLKFASKITDKAYWTQ